MRPQKKKKKREGDPYTRPWLVTDEGCFSHPESTYARGRAKEKENRNGYLRSHYIKISIARTGNHNNNDSNWISIFFLGYGRMQPCSWERVRVGACAPLGGTYISISGNGMNMSMNEDPREPIPLFCQLFHVSSPQKKRSSTAKWRKIKTTTTAPTLTDSGNGE